MAFFIGQKVVCIKRDRWRIEYDRRPMPRGERGPAFGEILTIREIVDAPSADAEHIAKAIRDSSPQVTEKMIRAALIAQAESDGPPHLAMREALLAALHVMRPR